MNTKKIHVGNLIAEAGEIYDYEKVTGYLEAKNADHNAFTKIMSVGGDADFQGWTGSAPKLMSVGGSAYFQGWTGSAPKLMSVGGSAYFRKWTGSAPKLTSIGRYADFRGWTGSAPKLMSVGGYADFRGWTGSAPKIKTNDSNAVAICSDALSKSFLASGYIFADGILAQIISRRGSVYKVVICGERESSFVIANGDGNYSHGATIKEARDSLIYKLQSRDLTEFEGWTLKTCVSLADAVKAYRSITGACEAGVRGFCERHGKMPAKLTVSKIVEMTKGKYGNEQFEKFFEGKK